MIKFAPCPPEQVSAADEIHEMSFQPGSPDFMSHKSFFELATNPNTKLFCAFEGNMPAGYVLFHRAADEAELLSIAVMPRNR